MFSIVRRLVAVTVIGFVERVQDDAAVSVLRVPAATRVPVGAESDRSPLIPAL
jgi:hypothetical protein